MFTTRPTLQGTFGMVSSTHWLASPVGDGRPGARRQRVRRGRRRGLRAARRRAAPERPRRRGADHPRRRRAAGAGAVRAGPAPGRSDASRTTAGSAWTWCPAPGRSPPPCPAPFDAWMLLLRDHGTQVPRRRAPLRHRVRRARAPRPSSASVRPWRRCRQLFETEWTSSAELYLPGGTAAAPGELLRNPALAATWQRLLAEVAARGRPRGADRRRAAASGARASSPRPSSRSRPRPTWTPPASRHAGTLTAADLAAGPATYEDARRPTTGTAGPSPRPGRGARARSSSSSSRCSRPTRREYGTAGRTCTCSSRACKLAMADREAWYGDAPTSRSTALLSAGVQRRPPRARRRTRLAASCGPARPDGRRTAAARPRRWRGAGRRGARRGPGRPGGGRADGRARRRHPGRHLPRRRRRPLGQHGRRHAQRRLAAVQPGGPGARASRSAPGCR